MAKNITNLNNRNAILEFVSLYPKKFINPHIPVIIENKRNVLFVILFLSEKKIVKPRTKVPATATATDSMSKFSITFIACFIIT